MKKNILLIGGSHGIGLSMVKQPQNEYSIYIGSRTKEELEGLTVDHITFDAITDDLDTSVLPEELHGFV